MFKNNALSKKDVKQEILSPEVKERLNELHILLEERYGAGFADSIMRPYIALYEQSRH
jgi:hypothetical protein